jgi:hypothetical protein
VRAAPPRAHAARPPAQNGAGRFDVGAGIEERVEDLDVVAAGVPMQRGHGVGPAKRALTSARRDQHADDRGAMG